MTDTKMLTQVKKLKKEHGPWILASKLGYRSPNTIRFWIKNDRIPAVALDRVRKLLKKCA